MAHEPKVRCVVTRPSGMVLRVSHWQRAESVSVCLAAELRAEERRAHGPAVRAEATRLRALELDPLADGQGGTCPRPLAALQMEVEASLGRLCLYIGGHRGALRDNDAPKDGCVGQEGPLVCENDGRCCRHERRALLAILAHEVAVGDTALIPAPLRVEHGEVLNREWAQRGAKVSCRATPKAAQEVE